MARLTLIALLVFAAPPLAGARPDASTEAEIAELLAAVEASPCTFIRNGAPHAAPDARSHMELKYGHVRRRVNSSEDFIEFAASKSSMTGQAYVVECPGEAQRPSRDWMLERLREVRSGSPADRSSQ